MHFFEKRINRSFTIFPFLTLSHCSAHACQVCNIMSNRSHTHTLLISPGRGHGWDESALFCAYHILLPCGMQSMHTHSPFSRALKNPHKHTCTRPEHEPHCASATERNWNEIHQQFNNNKKRRPFIDSKGEARSDQSSIERCQQEGWCTMHR